MQYKHSAQIRGYKTPPQIIPNKTPYMSTEEQTSCITTYRKVSLEKNKLFLDSVSRADTI